MYLSTHIPAALASPPLYTQSPSEQRYITRQFSSSIISFPAADEHADRTPTHTGGYQSPLYYTRWRMTAWFINVTPGTDVDDLLTLYQQPTCPMPVPALRCTAAAAGVRDNTMSALMEATSIVACLTNSTTSDSK